MPDTPLNPDALEAAAEAIATRNGFGYAQFSHKGDAHAAVRAYLSSLPVAPLELTNAEWQAFQAIPDQGYSHRAWVDARIAERVAVAQPEVNSDTELHVGTLIEDKTGQQLWNVWRTGGPAVHWMDDEGRPATPVFPARILYRPEVDE